MSEVSATSRTETDMIAILLAGATAPILEHLDGMDATTTVLDLACGTGEPAATILRAHPTWRLIGVDTAETALVAARERVPDARADFRLGSMTDLDLPDGSVDAVVSRMGALMTADTEATARDIARVLRPGGRVSIAAWVEQEHNPFLTIAADTARAVGVPAARVPDHAESFAAMAAPGVREGWLRAAGVTTVDSQRFSWNVRFPDFDTWWRYQTDGVPGHGHGGPLTDALRALDAAERDRLRAAMVERMARYRKDDASYTIPATAQHVRGVR